MYLTLLTQINAIHPDQALSFFFFMKLQHFLLIVKIKGRVGGSFFTTLLSQKSIPLV